MIGRIRTRRQSPLHRDKSFHIEHAPISCGITITSLTQFWAPPNVNAEFAKRKRKKEKGKKKNFCKYVELNVVGIRYGLGYLLSQ
jgi:hypothetical protein